MRIAFYKAKNGKFLDKTISTMTRSQYSHCEIVFPDGLCASASPRDGGIRFKYITLGDRWDVYDLPAYVSDKYVREWFIKHEEQKYDFIGAFGTAFKLKLASSRKKYCSYSCAAVLQLPEINLSPGQLYVELKVRGMI